MEFFDGLKGLLSPDLVSTTATQLGESETGVRRAMDVAVPALLSGVTSRLQQGGEAANSLFSLLKGAGSAGLIHDLSTAILPSATSSDTGSTLLTTLFGGELPAISSALGKEADVKSISAGSLLGLASTMVAGFLGNRINQDGLTMGSLTAMLAGQRERLMGFLPSGLAGLLGLGVTTGTTAAAATTMTYSDEEKKGGLGMWAWLIPALVLAALAFFLLRGCNNKPVSTGITTDSVSVKVDSVKADVAAMGDTVAAKTEAAADTVKAAMENLSADVKAKFDALGPNVGVKLPNGITLNVPEKGVEGRLVAFLLDPATKNMTADQLKGKWFDFDRILFDTGKSTIRTASQEQIDNIAQIVKAFPTLKLKMGGYTDNSGSKASNMKLSAARAKAVMLAVAKEDNAASRLSSEGYGPEHPIAPNDTKENMEKNRRVSVRVVSL